MGDLYLLGDFVAALLVGGGYAMIAITHKEHRSARLLFVLAAIIFAARWVMWAFTTDTPWWGRSIAGAVIGALIAGGLPALLQWSKSREHALAPSSGTLPAPPQAPIVPATPLPPVEPKRMSKETASKRAVVWKQYYDVLAGPARDAMLCMHQLTVGWQYEIQTSGPQQFSDKLQHCADLVGVSSNEIGEIIHRNDFYSDIGNSINSTMKFSYSKTIFDFKEKLKMLPAKPDRNTIELLNPQFQEFSNSYIEYSNWIEQTKELIKKKMGEEQEGAL
jgi:hypothetical protein